MERRCCQELATGRARRVSARRDLRDDLWFPDLLGLLFRGDRCCGTAWKREVVHWHPVAPGLVHDIQPPGVIATRARLAAFAATRLSNSHSGFSFPLRHSRWGSSTNPVEDICRVKPPSSDAETL